MDTELKRIYVVEDTRHIRAVTVFNAPHKDDFYGLFGKLWHDARKA